MSYGYIEVISGSMFSGKTEELIRRMRRVRIAEQTYLVYKPVIDDRYLKGHVNSHNGDNFPATEIESSVEILKQVEDNMTRGIFIDVVAIDEAQFFDKDIVYVVKKLANRGVRVIVAGLDTDFRYEVFGQMGNLLAIANEVQKTKAICSVCKKHNADRTQRIINGNPAFYEDPTILVGGHSSYEPRCAEHHEVPHREPIVVESS